MPSQNEIKTQAVAPTLMSQKDFLDKLRKQMPDLSGYSDITLMNAVLKRRPDLTDKVANPMSGDVQAQQAQARAQAASKSLVSPEYWKQHPNMAGFTRGVLNSLPAAGATIGAAAAGPETLGVGSLLAAPGGAMLGRSLRDTGANYLGLENNTPGDVLKNSLSEGAISALTPGVTEAALHPIDTAKMAIGDYSRLMPRNLRPWIEPQMLEDFANSVGKGPRRIPNVSNFAQDVSSSTPTIEGQVMPDNFKFDPRGSYIDADFTSGDSMVPTRPQTTRTGYSSTVPKQLK
jgi:hypothetical protein